MAKAAVQPLHAKFDQDLRREMHLRLVERDEEIEIFILALLAKTHAFLYGPPGIAKSMLVETGMSLIGGLSPEDYFHILFMKSTTREDVFGPLMLSLLKQDRYKYQPLGFLPSARFVFGDEFWKANGAIQNALLWATNERKYRNDGEVVDLPLWSMFIASNELPQDEALLAIYDRFPLRKHVKEIMEPGSMVDMLSMEPPPAEPVVSWEEIERAHAEVQKVKIPRDVLEALVDAKSKLKEMSILPSDRRFKVALGIVKARAWLDGEVEADVEHLVPLQHVLWDDPDHYNEVKKLFTGMSNPIDLEIMDIMADLTKLSGEVETAIADPGDAGHQERVGIQLFEKTESAMADLTKIAIRLKGSKKRSVQLENAKQQILGITKRLLTKVFNMSEEDIAENGLDKFAQVDLASASNDEEETEDE